MANSEKQTLRTMSKGQRAAFLGAFLGWIFDYYEIFLLTFLVVPISADLQLSATQSAALFTVDLASLAVGGILFGVLADKLGRRDVLLVTVLIYAAATLARAAAPNYWVLMVLTAVAGTGLGGEYGVG